MYTLHKNIRNKNNTPSIEPEKRLLDERQRDLPRQNCGSLSHFPQLPWSCKEIFSVWQPENWVCNYFIHGKCLIFWDGGPKVSPRKFANYILVSKSSKWRTTCTSYENVVVELNFTHPPDDFSYCFGCPYDILVVLDDRTTMNMDPCNDNDNDNDDINNLILSYLHRNVDFF